MNTFINACQMVFPTVRNFQFQSTKRTRLDRFVSPCIVYRIAVKTIRIRGKRKKDKEEERSTPGSKSKKVDRVRCCADTDAPTHASVTHPTRVREKKEARGETAKNREKNRRRWTMREDTCCCVRPLIIRDETRMRARCF